MMAGEGFWFAGTESDGLGIWTREKSVAKNSDRSGWIADPPVKQTESFRLCTCGNGSMKSIW